jgi:branched-chain amino acid transport system substrate-binding protein
VSSVKAGALVLIGLVALAVLVAPLAAEAQPAIRIGEWASKTGAYAALGQNQLRGYQLCVKHTNEKGGLLGRKLELIVEDDQSQAAAAIVIYERLITRVKVDLILGPYGTPMTQPVADIPDKYKMPMILPTAATTAILQEVTEVRLHDGVAG